MAISSHAQGVWFPQWAEVLAQFPLKELERRAYYRAIVEYLRFCKQSRQRATVASARLFMERTEGRRRLGVSQLAAWKAGLNWFFKTAKQSPAQPGMTQTSRTVTPCAWGKEPPLAATDLGGPEWERKLIRELRTRHYEWRTEQAYRMWARRFAQWLERRGQSVPAAGEIELRDFLSDLATRRRAAVATQRQALNAVVFLVREALGKPLADFGDLRGPGLRADAGGVEPGGVPAFDGGVGGDAAIDGGVDVWQRGAADGVVAVAGKRCGFGTAAIGHPGGQGRQGPGDGGAGCVGGAVAGAS